MVSSGPLLGRELEINALNALVTAGLDHGCALVIVGEPGIGKSALLVVARKLARDAGYTVLETAGIESKMHLPFGGIHQTLAPLMGHLPAPPDAQREALATALGLVEGTNPDLFLIAEAALSLLLRESRDRPVIIVVDDVQWLDPQSHQILTFLAHRGVGSRICVIGATRPDHAGPFIDAGFAQLHVQGVDDQAAEALLSAHAGVLGTANLARTRHEAQGNPLALLELPRSWGDGPPTDEHPLAVSARLERAFAGRVAELPSETRDALLVAAVGSSSETEETFAALAAFGTRGSPGEILKPAVVAGLLSGDPDLIRFSTPARALGRATARDVDQASRGARGPRRGATRRHVPSYVAPSLVDRRTGRRRRGLARRDFGGFTSPRRADVRSV